VVFVAADRWLLNIGDFERARDLGKGHFHYFSQPSGLFVVYLVV